MSMYQDAIDCQNACNLSGLAATLARHMDEIWNEARAAGKGTDYVNRHPVVVMFMNQMLWLSTSECVSPSAFMAAQLVCEEKVRHAELEANVDRLAKAM